MKKFQLSKGLSRREAFGELIRKTQSFSAFTYDPETGIAITEPPLDPPRLFEKVFRFTSRSQITFEDVSQAPPIDTPPRG